jgi:hypothetical protein
MKAPTWLKVVTWLAAVLVLVVAAGYVLLSVKPSVLADAHILRVVQPGAPMGSTGGGPGGGTAPTAHQIFPVQPAGTGPASADYTVATKKFDVAIITTGPCWVQVTSSSAAVPLVSGVQPGGKVLDYPADGTMTVEVGSSAVIVRVTIKGKGAFADTPKVVPFTYTFAAA